MATTPPFAARAKKKKKGKADCKEDAKKFINDWESKCLANYPNDLADAADCAACFEICADYYAICEYSSGKICAQTSEEYHL